MSGGRSSKVKGTRVEREIVNQAKAESLTAVRSWGSDGRSAGESEAVDVKIEHIRFQVKARNKLPKFLIPEDGTDGYVFKEDRKEAVVVITYKAFLELLKCRNQMFRMIQREDPQS